MRWKDSLQRVDRETAAGLLATLNTVSLRSVVKGTVRTGSLSAKLDTERQSVENWSTADLRGALQEAIYGKARAVADG